LRHRFDIADAPNRSFELTVEQADAGNQRGDVTGRSIHGSGKRVTANAQNSKHMGRVETAEAMLLLSRWVGSRHLPGIQIMVAVRLTAVVRRRAL
jgi:hypothetical protein